MRNGVFIEDLAHQRCRDSFDEAKKTNVQMAGSPGINSCYKEGSNDARLRDARNVNVNGPKYECSCGYYNVYKIPCSHMLAVALKVCISFWRYGNF